MKNQNYAIIFLILLIQIIASSTNRHEIIASSTNPTTYHDDIKNKLMKQFKSHIGNGNTFSKKYKKELVREYYMNIRTMLGVINFKGEEAENWIKTFNSHNRKEKAEMLQFLTTYYNRFKHEDENEDRN
jgi:hypothetical protein